MSTKEQPAPGWFLRWKEGLFPLPGKWECVDLGQRIVWTETGRQPSTDWSTLLLVWGGVFVAMLGVLLLVLVPASVLGGLSMLLRGVPLEAGDDLVDLVWTFAGASAAMATMMAGLCMANRHVFHAEFDLATGTLLLREATFPNRHSDIALPFADIAAIHLRTRIHGGPADVQLRLRKGEKTIGRELDEAVIAAHLERLRPALGERVEPGVVFDP